MSEQPTDQIRSTGIPVPGDLPVPPAVPARDVARKQDTDTDTAPDES